MAARRAAVPARRAAARHARTPDRDRLPRALGRPEPAVAVRRGRRSREAAGGARGVQGIQCRRAENLFRRARGALCRAQARRARGGAMPVRGVRRHRDRDRPSARPPHHAGDGGIFGRHGGEPDVARRPRRGHRHGLGLDPRSRRDRRNSRRARRLAADRLFLPRLSRATKATAPSSNAPVGKSGATSRPACCSADAGSVTGRHATPPRGKKS